MRWTKLALTVRCPGPVSIRSRQWFRWFLRLSSNLRVLHTVTESFSSSITIQLVKINEGCERNAEFLRKLRRASKSEKVMAPRSRKMADADSRKESECINARVTSHLIVKFVVSRSIRPQDHRRSTQCPSSHQVFIKTKARAYHCRRIQKRYHAAIAKRLREATNAPATESKCTHAYVGLNLCSQCHTRLLL